MTNKNNGYQGGARRWAMLLCSFGLVALFAFVVGPAIENRFECVGTLGAYIQENNINSGAIYWTDVEQTADAEIGARHSVMYTPTGPQ